MSSVCDYNSFIYNTLLVLLFINREGMPLPQKFNSASHVKNVISSVLVYEVKTRLISKMIKQNILTRSKFDFKKLYLLKEIR